VKTFCIRIANKDFTASNEVELADDRTAKAEALKGALEIGIEEVCAGKPFFGAEVAVEREGRPIQRLMIAVGASPLL
jgi:hypothetical protein